MTFSATKASAKSTVLKVARLAKQTMFCNSPYLLLKTRHEASPCLLRPSKKPLLCPSWPSCSSPAVSSPSPTPPPSIPMTALVSCVAAHAFPAGNHCAGVAGGGVGCSSRAHCKDEASEHNGFDRHGVADTTKKRPLSGLRKHFPKQLRENIKMLENHAKFQVQNERANFCSFQNLECQRRSN